MKDNTIVIHLEPKPRSLYSIITLIFFIVFLVLAVFLPWKFQASPVTAIALLFVPLAVLIFLFKILIWNLFGKETIVIKKKEIEDIYDYKYIYPILRNTYKKNKFVIKFKTNSTNDLISLGQGLDNSFKDDLFKLVIVYDKDSSFMSSKSFNQEKVKEIVSLIQ